MPIHVIRHELSEANNRDNIGTLAFAAKDAPLMNKGRERAQGVGATLSRNYGITPSATPTAVSELLRTRQTAEAMGFRRITPYASLNEVEHGMEGVVLRAMLDASTLPEAALRAAEAILHRPPSETVWVTHGLVIAGLSHILGVSDQFERLIPRFCEIRTLSI